MERICFLLTLALISRVAYPQEPEPATPPAAPGRPPASAPSVSVPTFPNSTCPIMGKKISERLFVDTERGRIYMCCKACTKKIVQDVPKAHETAYPVVKRLETSHCPITGEKLGKDRKSIIIQGYEIPVCCKDCIPSVQENAQIVLTKLLNPKLMDLENVTCPITGKPIEKNTFCLIGETLVRLSSPGCVEEVRRDPVKTLEKAKTLRAKTSPPPKHGRDQN